MILHCASRFGALSFLYENRHSIAYSIGLITEIPIAMCNSDYDFEKGLMVEASDPDDRMPNFAQAHEINLFYVQGLHLPEPNQILAPQKMLIFKLDGYYLSPVDPIFHPPLA